jgi:hypothetical protein
MVYRIHIRYDMKILLRVSDLIQNYFRVSVLLALHGPSISSDFRRPQETKITRGKPIRMTTRTF